jgi:hypothetical protein
LLFKRGWVTFVQPFALPEILSASLAEDFRFLKTLPLDYPPQDLPSLKQIGKVCPIARSELLGLDMHRGVEKLFRCIAPHSPVQIVPEMGIQWRVKGLTFSETILRIDIHPFGLALSLGSLFEVEPDSGGLTGFALARILNNLERNRGVHAATRAFRQPKCVLDIFYQLRRMMASQMFQDKISSRAADEVFCVFSPDDGSFPLNPSGVPDGQPDRLALFSALERFTGNEKLDAVYLGNKCFTAEGEVSLDRRLLGWIFGSEHGLALFIRPAEKAPAATRARRCNHKNISRLIGWYLLYQSYLAGRAGSPDQAGTEFLQHAVDAYDTMAVRYSRFWIRWARARFRLDEPVKAVVKAYGLKRTHPPDDHIPLPQANLRVFISYSHADGKFCAELEKHLEILQQENILESWSDRRLHPGQEWDGVINEKLNSANLILLLISADFLLSKYVRETEIRLAISRQQAGDAVVIPVILDETDWKGSPFADFQALPSQGKPVSRWRSHRAAAADVAAGIRALARGPSAHPDAIHQPPPADGTPPAHS